MWDAKALRALDWEGEVLQAIRYEVEKKLAKATRMTMEEPAAPWSDNNEDFISKNEKLPQ